MSDSNSECESIIDVSGLCALMETCSNSTKSKTFDLLEEGVIAIPTMVWNEFKQLYEIEAEEISEHINVKIKSQLKYKLGAAKIADKMNSHFSSGPFDQNTDLYSAAIAGAEGLTLLTSPDKLAKYKDMDFCEFESLEVWIDENWE